MKRIILLPFFFLIVINSYSSIWNTISDKTIVSFYETKADNALIEMDFIRANEYYKKALNYTDTRQIKGEIFFKISKLYYLKSKTNPEKRFKELYNSVSKLEFSKKYLTIFPDDYSAIESSILLEARKLIDQQKEDNTKLQKLSKKIHQISSDEFDLIKLTHLQYESGLITSNNLIDLMVNDTSMKYEMRRKKFHNSLINKAICDKDYTFLKDVEQTICHSSNFKKMVDDLLIEHYNGIVEAINFDTLDANNISYTKFEQYLKLRDELLNREVIEDVVTFETRFMALCCMKHCIDKKIWGTDSSTLWLLKLNYENLLPNEEFSFVFASGVLDDKLDWPEKDSARKLGQNLYTPLYYNANFSNEDAGFTNYLTLFTKNFSSGKPFGFSFFTHPVLSNIDPKKELLKISDIDPLHAYKLVYYSSWESNATYAKDYMDGVLYRNLSSLLNREILVFLNNNELDSALKHLYSLNAILAELDEKTLLKTYNSYFKLLENLIEEKDFSLAYELYIVLSKSVDNDMKLLASKKELIKNDWEVNYVTSHLNDSDFEWSGNFDNCKCGKMPDSYYQKMRKTLAFYRRIAEIPDNLIFKEEYNKLAQAAALVNSFGKLSHTPSPLRPCYSEDAYRGSSSSNLSGSIGVFGYMVDHGESNKAVGHRRWILNPYNSVFGIGATYGRFEKKWETGSSSWSQSGGALHVFAGDDNNSQRFKDYSKEGTGWPMEGYFPYEFTFKKWSYSLGEADFSNAKVTLKLNDGTIIHPTTYPISSGYGLNTIVWEYIYKEKLPKHVEVIISGVILNNETKRSEIRYKVHPFMLDKKDEDYDFWVCRTST
jgi:hypothetical protein